MILDHAFPRVRYNGREGYGKQAMLDARTVLVETTDPVRASKATGVPARTILDWNRKYGWVKLKRGHRVGHARRGIPDIRHWLDTEPKTWRCDCSRLNTGTQCGTCGHRPAWAA